MAASSPTPNNNKAADSTNAIVPVNGNTTPQTPRSILFDTPRQNLRGLNKPKCIKCGNVARSRCPFQSCKSCCAKAQNPCHIHVLKQSTTLPDKPPPSSSPMIEQPSPDVPSAGSSWRLTSLRQLSATFPNSLRSRKPLTTKDAVNINKWRFSKLREHIRGNIEAENEAFERYISNVGLLEETFSVESDVPEDQIRDLVSSTEVKLEPNPRNLEGFREKMRALVERKLRELREREHVKDQGPPYTDESDGEGEIKRPKKVGDWRSERMTAMADLVDKLSKARSEDDLKSCMELKLQLLKVGEDMVVDKPGELPKQETLPFSPPKVFSIVPIDEGTLSGIDREFSSQNQILEL